MKITLVIPTYWTSSKSKIQRKNADATYDHPTPLESQSSLPRLLRSLINSDLPRDSTSIVVIAAVTHHKLEEKAACRVDKITEEYQSCFNIKSFSGFTLNKLLSTDENLASLLNLYGYSNIRNLGLAAAQILNSDIIVFLDDDVIVNDRAYFQKITQYIGKQSHGKFLGGVAGYYTNQAGIYRLDIDPKQWWKVFWPKEKKMNEAFKIIETKRRLVESTFAFGGNLALHWRMFERIPFDPYITRGEDMDLLLNAKMFGFEFQLDTELKVVHLPGEEKVHWSEIRQDLFRFLYMREKMISQKNVKNINHIAVDALEPYPGYFLGSEMLLRFAASSSLNCLHSLVTGEIKTAKEFLCNFTRISQALHSAKDHSLDYFVFQKRWSSILPKIRNNKEFKKILED